MSWKAVKAQALEAARLLIAQPAPAAAPISGPLVIAGFFSTASGMGELARSCAAAFKAKGRAVVCVDIGRMFGQTDFSWEGDLSPMPRSMSGTLILFANAPEIPRALIKLGMFKPRRWKIVGGWAWELPVIPATWRGPSAHLSEIWAPTEFVADAIRSQLAVTVRTVRPWIDPPQSATADKSKFGVREDHLLCLVMADARSSFVRKNIDGAIRAFRKAAGERGDARLIVKTRNAGDASASFAAIQEAAGGDERIRFIDRSMSSEERWALIASCDIFLSLHRAEGLAFSVAEAMALGKTAVTTAWSGVMDYACEENALLVPYSMQPVRSGMAVYDGTGMQWAEPNETEAAARLRAAMESASLRKSLGTAAQQRVRERFSADAIVAALNAAPPC